jgi:hypothetical protein
MLLDAIEAPGAPPAARLIEAEWVPGPSIGPPP